VKALDSTNRSVKTLKTRILTKDTKRNIKLQKSNSKYNDKRFRIRVEAPCMKQRECSIDKRKQHQIPKFKFKLKTSEYKWKHETKAIFFFR
jgi:ribosomal protein RSM22 (predicted rRNA methylase)